MAIDDDPRRFPSHENSLEPFDWTTIVVGLSVLFSLGKWALNRRNAQRLNRSVDICSVISTSCPTVVPILPDMCLRPNLSSVYDPSSYPTPSCFSRQGHFYGWGCERVLDGVQSNISTKAAFEILNGAARPKFQQNGADVGCGNYIFLLSLPSGSPGLIQLSYFYFLWLSISWATSIAF